MSKKGMYDKDSGRLHWRKWSKTSKEIRWYTTLFHAFKLGLVKVRKSKREGS